MEKVTKHILLIIIILLLLQNIKLFIPIKGVESSIVILVNNGQKITFKNDEEDNKNKDLEMLDIEKGLKIKNISKSVILINNITIYPNKTKIIKVKELTKKNKISIRIKFKDSKNFTNYKINTIPSDFRDWIAEGKSKFKGDYYLEMRSEFPNGKPDSYLVKINNRGKVMFYKKNRTLIYGFKKIRKNPVLYSYITWVSDTNRNLFKMLIIDKNYNEIDSAVYIGNDGVIKDVDRHDVIYIDNKHYVIGTIEEKEVNNFPEELGYGNNMKVKATLIEEIKDGKVLWEFDSTDYPELYKYFDKSGVYDEIPSKNNFQNYMHFNSFAIDPSDNNLVVSFRNISSLIKINRKTGKIMWILGGKGDEFGLTERQKFMYQHSISFVDKNTILLYDNGYYGENQNLKPRKSRVIKIKIDEKNKKIKKYESYNLGVYTKTWGSVQHIKEDIYLLDYGFGDYKGKSIIEEKNLKTGKVYFKFQFVGYPSAHIWKDL